MLLPFFIASFCKIMNLFHIWKSTSQVALIWASKYFLSDKVDFINHFRFPYWLCDITSMIKTPLIIEICWLVIFMAILVDITVVRFPLYITYYKELIPERRSIKFWPSQNNIDLLREIHLNVRKMDDMKRSQKNMSNNTMI